MAQFDVYSTSVQNIISWIKSGEVAIPEIQRPFVWGSSKVRDTLLREANSAPLSQCAVFTFFCTTFPQWQRQKGCYTFFVCPASILKRDCITKGSESAPDDCGRFAVEKQNHT